MKIGTFVMGGLAGAAIAIWMQRNRRMSSAAASVGQNVKHRVAGLKDDAIEKAMNMKFAGAFRRSGESNSEHRASASSDGEGKEIIESLISQDPDVGKEVDAILNQNGHPHS